MKRLAYLIATAAVFGMSNLAVGAPAKNSSVDPLIGDWQSFDDRTGAQRSIIRVSKNKKTGLFQARIIKRNKVAGMHNSDLCDKCPAPFTNKKVVGMSLFWNLKKFDKAKRGGYNYRDGYLIDPGNGRIYRIEIKLSKDGNLLTGRGYVDGVRSLGRRQTWMRMK